MNDFLKTFRPSDIHESFGWPEDTAIPCFHKEVINDCKEDDWHEIVLFLTASTHEYPAAFCVATNMLRECLTEPFAYYSTLAKAKIVFDQQVKESRERVSVCPSKT